MDVVVFSRPVVCWGSLATSAACLRARVADSWGSSVVWYVEHVVAWNLCTECLRWAIALSKNESVSSVCSRSLPRPCQVAKSKSRSKMTSLCGEDSSPSKTGIAHYVHIFSLWKRKVQPLTWSRSSKSLAASRFIADAILWNLQIVPHPNILTFRYLPTLLYSNSQ